MPSGWLSFFIETIVGNYEYMPGVEVGWKEN